MNRREFTKKISSMFTLSALGATLTLAGDIHAAETDPLSGLIDVQTGKAYKAEPNTHRYILFMTAQQIYKGCDAAFLEKETLKFELQDKAKGNQYLPNIEYIMIVPPKSALAKAKLFDNMNNISQAQRYGVKVLIGEKEHVFSIANKYGENIYALNSQRKVIDHTLDTFFTDANGKLIMRYDSGDGMGWASEIDKLYSKCESLWSKPSFCPVK